MIALLLLVLPLALQQELLPPASPTLRSPAAETSEGGIRIVRGSLVRPPGVPRDEDLRLFAAAFERGEGLIADRYLDEVSPPGYSRATRPRAAHLRQREDPVGVREDGRFMVTVPAAASRLILRLDGRYLHAPALVVDLGEPAPEPVMKPTLGAWLTGEFRLPHPVPEGLELSEPGGFEVRLTGSDNSDTYVLWFYRTLADRELHFEFRGVPVNRRYYLGAAPQRLARFSATSMVLAPGEHARRSHELSAGIVLRGKVVDPEGTPVPGARVRSRVWFRHWTSTVADADGAFVLAGVHAKRTRLFADAPGHLASAGTEQSFDASEVHDDLELRLGTSRRMAGRVTWPDGSAAPGIAVRIMEPADGRAPVHGTCYAQFHSIGQAMQDPSETGLLEHHTSTDSDGHFEFAGLGAGPFEVTAATDPLPIGAISADPFDRVRLPIYNDAGSTIPPVPTAPPRGRASSGPMEALEDIALVLAPPVPLRGRVIDELGEPLEEFAVQLRGGRGSERLAPLEELFVSTDGHFRMNAPADEWEVVALAPGHEESEPLKWDPVVVPKGEEEIELVCASTGSRGLIAGTVTGPDGSPIAGASVEALDWLAIHSDEWQRATTDEHGAFSIETPWARLVRVRHPDWAISETLEAFPESDPEHAASLEFVLHPGGTLTGVVYTGTGAVDPGRALGLWWTDYDYDQKSKWGAVTLADAAGRFTFDHLQPGNYSLSTTRREGAPIPVPGKVDPDQQQLQVEIAEGRTTDVGLGPRPDELVWIVGQLSEAGFPRPGAEITAIADGGDTRDRARHTITDSAGNFRMSVASPGNYTFWVMHGGREDLESHFTVTVPRVPEHRLSLELPTGRILGRVLGPDGSPAAELHVRCQDLGRVTLLDMWRWTNTDDSGRFELSGLPPGTYSLRAGFLFGGEGLFLGMLVDENELGIGIVTNLVLAEGQTLEEIEIHLQASAGIRGQVLGPTFEPVEGATVFIRDEQGRTLNPFSNTSTGPDGRYLFTCAHEGVFTISAALGTLASAESEPFYVAGARTTAAYLQLAPASILIVSARGPDGPLLDPLVRVFDSAGRTVHDRQPPGAVFDKGVCPTESRIGPLVPGRYLVEVTAGVGRIATREIQLTGEPEQRVELTLPD